MRQLWQNLLASAARILPTVQQDLFFWLSIPAVVLIVTAVPQVNGVMLQLAETPPPAVPEAKDFWQSVLMHLRSLAFLAYVAFFGTLMAASVFVVVPPSFLSVGARGAMPVPAPVVPAGRGQRLSWLGALVIFISLLLAYLFVWRPLPPWVLIVLAAVLLYPPARATVAWASDWLVEFASWMSDTVRWRVGVAMIGVWAVVYLVFGATGHGSRFYPLAGAACQSVGLLAGLTGLWLLCLPAPTRTPPHFGPVLTAPGRLLGWAWGAILCGEVMWLLALLPGGDAYVSHRLYTIWGVLALLTMILLVASLLDTWQLATRLPVRLAALLVVGLGFWLVVAPPAPLERIDNPRVGLPPPAAEEWGERLLARIRRVPDGEPIAVVAASGGGSRAAIFTGLVLDSLAREPFPGGRAGETWADRVVLISGVSGGSLGTARFVHEFDGGAAWNANPAIDRADLRSSERSDLILRMRNLVKELEEASAREQPFKDVWSSKNLSAEQRLVTAEADREKREWLRTIREACDRVDGSGFTDPTWGWVIRSRLADDLSGDFMAPVIRGALAPAVSRGHALRRFWTQRFGWGRSNDRDGYDLWKPDQGWTFADFDDPSPARPLAVFNTTDVRQGTRVAVGFPPLPPGFFRHPSAPPAFGRREPSPQTFADIDPTRPVGLGQAVGLSANFPFGFNVLTVPRDGPTELDTPLGPPVHLLDGGIVDNTGIDTLFLLLQAINARSAAANSVYARIRKELDHRRIVLIEIDSGSKPSDPGLMTRHASVIFEPIDSLNNASFTNASLTKTHYFGELLRPFGPYLEETSFIQKIQQHQSVLGEQETARLRRDVEREALEGYKTRFDHLKFELNHFHNPNVTLAWALSPDDKATILVRFLLNAQQWRRPMQQVNRMSAKAAAEDRRKALDGKIDAAVRARVPARLRELLAEFDQLSKLGKEGVKAKDPLLKAIVALKENLGKLQESANRINLADKPFAEEVQRLAQSLREKEDDLKSGKTAVTVLFTDFDSSKLTSGEFYLKDLPKSETDAQAKLKAVLEVLNSPGRERWKLDYQSQATQELFNKAKGVPAR